MELSAPAPHEHERLVHIWEAAVRATHHFFTEADMAVLCAGIRPTLAALRLVCARDERGQIVGFLGVSGEELDMLFVAPEAMGQGVGHALLAHALGALGARRLEVYEQNLRARAFYAARGFVVGARSATNGLGMPYPVLQLVYQR